MSTAIHRLATLATAAALCGAAVVAHPAAVHAVDATTLVSAEATFDTLDNDKDHDTLVTISVKRGNTVIASARSVGGHYNDHSRHTVALDIVGSWSRDDLKSRTKTALSITTNGSDKWEVTYTLKLTWSDGSTTEQPFERLVLTQDDPSFSGTVAL